MRPSPGSIARIRQDLGGEWFLDAPALLTIVIPTTLASVADLAEPNAASVAGWTVANLVAFLPCVLIAAALVRATRRRRGRRPLPILVTLATGALLGGVKVLGTTGMGAVLGLTSTGFGSNAGRLLQGAVVGMAMVPVVVLIRATLARHRMEHRLLVAETFAGLIDPVSSSAAPMQHGSIAADGRTTEEGAAAREEAALVLGELRGAIQRVPASEAARLLTSAVEEDLRPLTHRLWSGAMVPSSDLTFRGLVRAMLRRPAYPVLVPMLVHGLVITLFALNRVTPLRAVVTGLVAAGTLATLLALARASRPSVESTVSGTAHLSLVLIAAAASATLVRGLLVPEFVLTTAGLVGLVVAWIVPIVLASSIAATVVHDRDAVRAQLVAMLGPDWYGQLRRSHLDAAAARDVADRLHGDLQGELIAAAARIDRLGHDEHAIGVELKQVAARIECAMSARPGDVPSPLAERLGELGARWAGLLDVQLELDVAAPLGRRFDDLIVGIVSEALTNARRHGTARQVVVRVVDVRRRGEGLRVEVEDDGVGPGTGAAGIGSAHLDAVAPGAWSRIQRPAGGTRLEVVLAAGRMSGGGA